jgi:Ca-activated chloride channel family protein
MRFRSRTPLTEAVRQAAGVGATARVVGFGMTAGEGAQVACRARETGGQSLLAADGAGLAAALAATVAAVPVPATAEAPRGPLYPGAADMPGLRLAPTGRSRPGTHAPVTAIAFAADGTAAQCRALCEADAACHAGRFEGRGSYAVAEARCFVFDAGAAFDWDLPPSSPRGCARGTRRWCGRSKGQRWPGPCPRPP